VVYVPPNKYEQESVQYVSDLMRELADVVISDVNSGINRMKEVAKQQENQFVVVNGRDVYLVEVGVNQLELVKQMKTPLLEHIKEVQLSKCAEEGVDLKMLRSSIEKYGRLWELLMGEKSWSLIEYSTIEYYKSQCWLTKDCEKFRAMKDQSTMLSKMELELIHQDLLGKASNGNALRSATLREVAHDVI
jgi:hypothetical protein